MYLWITEENEKEESSWKIAAVFSKTNKRAKEKKKKKKESIFYQILYDYGFIIETYFRSTKLLR